MGESKVKQNLFFGLRGFMQIYDSERERERYEKEGFRWNSKDDVWNWIKFSICFVSFTFISRWSDRRRRKKG